MIPTAKQVLRASSSGKAYFEVSCDTVRDPDGLFVECKTRTIYSDVIDSSKNIVQWFDAGTGRRVKPREDWEFRRADGRPLDGDDKKADNATIATIGPYTVELTVGTDLRSRYVVRHGHGGLVPTQTGFASEATFNAESDAREHATACFSALLSGKPTPFASRAA